MIGFLKGTVLSSNEKSMLLLVSGVGYLIHAPIPLLVSVTEKQELSLYIHTHVREAELSLYGFKDKLDLFMFEKLLSVSGIGPKSALAMLSIHSPVSIAHAVERNDITVLSHTPGIGKKTVEKLILELRGKLSHLIGKEENDTTHEVRLALETLGYSPKEIQEAVQKLDTKDKSTSVLIKESLTYLQ